MRLKKIHKTLIVVLIIIILELTVFNFRYFLIRFSGLSNETIDVNDDNLSSNDFNGFLFKKTYKIKLNNKIKGIKLNLSQDTNYKEIKITPKFKDETKKNEFKELEQFKYMPKYKNREYVVLNSQKNCLELEFDLESNGNFKIESIELNTWYFEFNWIRVLSLIVFACLVMYYREINNHFEKNPNDKRIVYIGFISILTILFIYYCYGFGTIYEKSSCESGMVLKDIYRELTQSIMKGKITLDFPENYREELSKLQNYQDYSERVEKGVKYLYDAAFYKGNYYCYYGIIPVATVLLPIALITGIYCYSNVVCIVYGTLVMILLLKIYLRILKKFKIKFGFLLEFVGYLTIVLTMELFRLKFEPNFYQAVDLCGIFWLLFAFWQILNLENEEKIKQKLFLIGMSYGFMVLTRPVYVFYIVPIVIAIWKYLIKDKKLELKNIAVFILPIIIMAIFQMWYNYIRFENIFEFGQFYQITINDTSSLEMEPGLAIDGIFSFLFNPPLLSRHFPFVDYNEANVKNGNEIFTMGTFGLLWHQFLLILLTAKNRINNNRKIKKLKIYSVTFLLISIIILIINTCWAGVIQRYLTDVLPTLTIISLFYWLLYINESKNKEVKNERIKLYRIVCISSVIIMSLYAFSDLDNFMLKTVEKTPIDKRIIQYNIKHSIEFYK